MVPLVAVVREVELPPLALVESRDETGQTWQKTGRLSGTVPLASQDFRGCLERQGWHLDKSIAMGTGSQRSVLYLWKKNKQDLMLMLWEKKAGETGFSIGQPEEVAQSAPSARSQAGQNLANPKDAKISLRR
jgi:hypothetical protein